MKTHASAVPVAAPAASAVPRIAPVAPLAVALAALLSGCSPEIGLTAVNNYCTDVDLDNLPAVELFSEVDGDTARVWLSYDIQPAGLEFVPTYDTSGKTVEVFSLWDGEGGGEDFCYEPTVEITGLKGKMEIRWYISQDDASPYDTIEIESEK